MKKNLLVLTNGFPDKEGKRYNCQFVLEYTKLAKDFFDHIYVISPQPIFPKVFGKIPKLSSFGRFANFCDYNIDNISVFYPKFFTLPFPSFRRKNYVSFLRCAQKTIGAEKLSFELIHAHFLSPTGLAALELKKETQKRLILTPHGGDIYSWPYESSENLSQAKMILEGADKITSNSNSVYEDICKIADSAKSKIVSIPNFVDSKRFKITPKEACRNKLNLPLDKKILLNVANLTDGKGHLELLKAFKLLDGRLNADLYIIGAGELLPVIQSQIQDLGIADRVILIGSRPNEELPLWYGASDLFVFPSHFESFGIVQIEALACGLPVVAYANSGSREIIKNSSIGLLSPIGDIEAFARRIELGLKADWQRENLRSYAVKEYSSEIVRSKLLSCYKSLNL